MVDKPEKPVAIITGAASNIGWATALRFMATHRVLLADIKPFNAQMHESGATHAIVDVTDFQQCAELMAAAERLGPVAVLVNSAGVTGPAVTVEELPVAEWRRVLNVNLTGTFNVMKAAVPALKRAHGAAVLISSRAGKAGYAALNSDGTGTKAHYCASKAGVMSLTKSLALELSSHGVRINCVAPGSIEGTMIPSERWPEIAKHVPLGRLGKPEEVAEACYFLCSPAASYITGHVLDVNGGTLMD